jgi:hypothetical protein
MKKALKRPRGGYREISLLRDPMVNSLLAMTGTSGCFNTLPVEPEYLN